MGQREVIDYLNERKGKWFTSRDIIDDVVLIPQTAHRLLAKLRKYNVVQHKIMKHDNGRAIKRTFFYSALRCEA